LAASLNHAAAQSLLLERRIELPSVHGRIDHMDVDVAGSRLFVAALGAGSLEVVDLNAGERVARIQPLREPQGVLYLPTHRRLIAANGAGGGVVAFADGKTPAIASAAELDDADNLRFDPASNRVVVGYGQALAILDPTSLRVVRRVALAGHPEAFQLESAGPLIYVNVPSAGQVAVVDRRSGTVAATWDVAGASRNFPMALDEANHRLFIATRQPARLMAYDTGSGKRVAEISTCGDADDLFFDERRRRLYVVCGEGAVDVVRQHDADHYESAERIATAAGARTGLFVAQLPVLFVAAPSRDGANAEIRIYRIK
jgi:DNA-binding beta-propeller fold protein YncE